MVNLFKGWKAMNLARSKDVDIVRHEPAILHPDHFGGCRRRETCLSQRSGGDDYGCNRVIKTGRAAKVSVHVGFRALLGRLSRSSSVHNGEIGELAGQAYYYTMISMPEQAGNVCARGPRAIGSSTSPFGISRQQNIHIIDACN
jgi:hypothetical protein